MPPVAFFELVAMFVVPELVIDTLPPATTSDDAPTYADTLCVFVTFALFAPTPIAPPPEPDDVADVVPSPAGGIKTPSGMPPGPRICCRPAGSAPVRSMRSVCSVSAVVVVSMFAAGLVMSATGVNECCSAPAPPRPDVSNVNAGPVELPMVMSEPETVFT